MATREVDPLEAAIGAAMDDTNKEIFSEAWGKEDLVHDETGDRSIEQMGEGLEGQHEPDEDEIDESDEDEGEESDGEEDEESEQETPAKTEADKTAPPRAETAKTEREGRVPSGKLREANERARAAEAALKELQTKVETERGTSRKEVDDLRAQMNGILAALQQRPQSQQQDEKKTDTVPDLFENPTAFVEHLQKGFQTELSARDRRLDEMRVENSMAIAHAFHKDVFEAAYQAVTTLDQKNLDNQATVRRIWTSPNPGEALVQWHKRNETLREVGDDPSAYKTRIRAEEREALMKDPEFRKQLIAELRGEASGANGGEPRTAVRLPKSLNGAAGGNAASRESDPLMYDDSDSAVFQSAWR